MSQGCGDDIRSVLITKRADVLAPSLQTQRQDGCILPGWLGGQEAGESPGARRPSGALGLEAIKAWLFKGRSEDQQQRPRLWTC